MKSGQSEVKAQPLASPENLGEPCNASGCPFPHGRMRMTTPVVQNNNEILEVFPCGSDGKESACNAGATGDVGQEDPLEVGMATHSNILAWKIPWTEEPGKLQFIGFQRDGHD